MPQRLPILGIGISVAVYLLTQLYIECTLTEWSAWGPCTDFEVLPSLSVAAAASAGVVRAVVIAVHRSVLSFPVEHLSRVPPMLGMCPYVALLFIIVSLMRFPKLLFPVAYLGNQPYRHVGSCVAVNMSTPCTCAHPLCALAISVENKTNKGSDQSHRHSRTCPSVCVYTRRIHPVIQICFATLTPGGTKAEACRLRRMRFRCRFLAAADLCLHHKGVSATALRRYKSRAHALVTASSLAGVHGPRATRPPKRSSAAERS